jgi:ESCRT-II complex subunit VPS22
LEVQLTEFAKKHRHEIQHDPAFRHQFLQMCAPLGVDPLSTKKSFWGKLLGMGDFYHELAVKVAEVCLANRSRNGGIMSIAQVEQILRHRNTKFRLAGEVITPTQYSKQDIQTAISKLSCLGGGFRTLQVGTSLMIVSVPTELDSDHMILLTLAQDLGGISLDHVRESTGWNAERAQRSLDLLLTQGMAWLDVCRGERQYWFPR